MKKTFQKTLIAAAAGVALMSAAGTASANSLLFPYFTTNSGAQSVLSLSANNTAAGGSAGETIHYVYNYGSSCTHFDGNGKLTTNDLLQHSIAATAAGGFGKAVSTDASTPFYFPLANSFGFLTVTNKTTVGAVISGEMAIVDPSTGLVTSYAGISNGLETVGTTSEGDFSGITDEKFDLRFFGSAVTSTSWYGVVTGNMYTAITAGANWTGGQQLTNNGVVYNNDESPISGTATKNLICAGSFTANDLMNTAQQAAVGGNGGLIHATGSVITPTVTNGVGYTSSGLILMKLQAVQSAVGAPFAGKQFLHREAVTPF
jgi:hypothetical protein